MDEKVLERLASIEARQFTQEEKTEILVGIKKIPELDKNCEKRTEKIEAKHEKDVDEIKREQSVQNEKIIRNRLSIAKIIAWATGAGSASSILVSAIMKLMGV